MQRKSTKDPTSESKRRTRRKADTADSTTKTRRSGKFSSDMKQGNAKLTRRINEWMRGRNGADALANAFVWIAVLLYIINFFAKVTWVWWFALACLAYAWWRMTSRDIQARTRENEAFLSHVGGLRPWLQDTSAAWHEARLYKHLKCPNCGQRVRVPRHKGKLLVSCPKCHTKFDARS